MKFPEHREFICMEYRDFQGDLRRLQVTADGTCENFITTFRAFLAVCGFHEDTIADMLNEEIARQDDNMDEYQPQKS